MSAGCLRHCIEAEFGVTDIKIGQRRANLENCETGADVFVGLYFADKYGNMYSHEDAITLEVHYYDDHQSLLLPKENIPNFIISNSESFLYKSQADCYKLHYFKLH